MKRLVLISLLGLGIIVGCNNTAAPPVIAITFTSGGAPALDQSQTLAITVTIANDATNKGVTFSLSQSGAACTAACGTLTNATATSVMYNAPASVTSNMVVTITATSVADPTKMSTATVTVTPLPSVTTTTLPNGTVGVVYSATLQESGGVSPFTWSIVAGTLPNGLGLTATTGAISGTPTAQGTSTFTVKVADSGNPSQSAQKQLSITIQPAPLVVTTTALPNGTVNSAYPSAGATLQFSGGTPPVTWSISAGALPGGLVLAATGQITGTPTTAGTFNFTVKAADSGTPQQTATKDLSITVNPPLSVATTSLPSGSSGSAYSATLQSAGGTPPVTWSITLGTLPAGLMLNAATGVISGTPTTPGTSNFTVQAADSSVPQQTATKALSITIAACPLAITTPSLPNGTVGIPYNQTISATCGTPRYRFDLAIGSGPLPGGLNLTTNLNNQGVISGTPTTSGPFTFTVQASDSGTSPQTTTKTYTVNIGNPNNGLLNGQYAFLFTGFDASGPTFTPVSIAGSFTAGGNGTISSGIQDVNRTSGVTLSQTFTGTYIVGGDNRGIMTLTAGATALGTFRFALGSVSGGIAAKGRFIEFDGSGTRGAGVIEKQDPTAFSTAQVSGDYAFGASSPEASDRRLGVAGRFTASAGAITAGAVDYNENGMLGTNKAFTGAYTITTPNGRGTFTLNISGVPNPVNAVLYAVKAGEQFMMGIDPQPNSAPFAGTALQQSPSPAALTNASLNGVSVLSANGNAGVAAVDLLLGLFTANSTTSGFTLSGDENNTGTTTTVNQSGTYRVASNGRVTITSGTTPPVFYLVSANKGFVLSTDSSVKTGFFEPQTGGPFSTASATGTFFFGTTTPVNASIPDESGVATFDGAGSVTGTSDSSQPSAVSPDNAFADTYSFAASGRGTTAGGMIIYIISPSKAVLMDGKAGSTNSAIQVAEK